MMRHNDGYNITFYSSIRTPYLWRRRLCQRDVPVALWFIVCTTLQAKPDNQQY